MSKKEREAQVNVLIQTNISHIILTLIICMLFVRVWSSNYCLFKTSSTHLPIPTIPSYHHREKKPSFTPVYTVCVIDIPLTTQTHTGSVTLN